MMSGSSAAWAYASGLDLGDLAVAPPTLEQVYLDLTGEAAEAFHGRY